MHHLTIQILSEEDFKRNPCKDVLLQCRGPTLAERERKSRRKSMVRTKYSGIRSSQFARSFFFFFNVQNFSSTSRKCEI